ncbi:MAG: multiprotein bridging factor aMBF1 [Candidatus Bathyarchaeota archaeon]|jgi:putative transcription factor|nr:multiprotein bridging factor aMBF1 [Candidatus Bathyarchaeota archaeon]
MRCEVCGSEIREQPYYRIIEGGRMTVCGRCARFGSADWDPNRVQIRTRSRPQPRRPRSEVEAAETLELVEDYGEKIRKARQKRRLSVEDFARMISEKESVVKKLEREELNPDRKLVRKIRNALNIDILEVGEPTPAPVSGRPATARTLGDIYKQSQKPDEKKEER